MTPGELRAALVNTRGNASLDVAALGSAPLAHLLGPSFALTGADDAVPDATGFTVTGTGASAPFTGLDVTARFTTDGTAVTAAITGRSARPWSLATPFPVLRGTVLESLTFQDAALTLEPGAQTAAFTGEPVITARHALLDLLMPGTDHAVHGTVGMLRAIPGVDADLTPVPDILLFGPEGASYDLGLFRLTGLRYEIFADPRADYATGDLTTDVRLELTGAIPFTAGGTDREILLGADIVGWGESALFTADLSDLGEAAFAEIAAFLGRDSIDAPFDLEITAPVVPRTLKALVQPGAAEPVSYVALTLETAHEWDTPLFTVQAVDLTVRVDTPLSAPAVSVALDGLVGLGEHATLEVSAGFGDETGIGGGLRHDHAPLTVREIWTGFTGEDATAHLPDVEVRHFDLSVALPPGGAPPEATGVLEAAGTWPVLDGVVLEDLRFAFAYADDVTFTADAALLVATAAVHVGATYGTARGWTFEGSTPPGTLLPAGELAASLAARWGMPALPAPLAGLTVHDLDVAFSTGDGRFLFTAAVRFPVDTTEVDLSVAIDTGAGTYGGAVAVVVRPGLELDFAVRFASAGNRYAVAYVRRGAAPTVRELVAALVPSAAEAIPASLVVGIDDALLAVEGDTHVFEVDLTATVDLTSLPIVGPHLGGDGTVGFDPLRVVAATGALTAEQVTALKAALPVLTGLDAAEYPAGFSFGGHLRLGPLDQPVTLPVGTPPQTAAAQAKTADDVVWYRAQADFGPLHVERVGLAYQHPANRPARLAVLVDASITVGGLTLSCDGLEAAVSLADPVALPSFDLAGLGVDYSGGPVHVAGAFLKGHVTYGGRQLTAYSGKAVIGTDAFTVGALGSYTELPEGPSLFVYAFLDYPIGGPAFFFVEGIAAGFGYNRRVVAPAVDRIAAFPLVAEALHTVAPATTLQDEMARLEEVLPPSPGDLFFAAGVHFTSFKMIDSFLLVTVQAGHRFELDVLGLSTLVVPVRDRANVTPVAEIQLALKATFAPDDGYFALTAQLTADSYLLSRACRLRGGFAFTTWFGDEHTGDFVLTVGGYHPHFDRPGHYPVVPRLGFDWQVSRQLSLTGSAYYALTPGALMAGAALSAVYEDGSLRAWFDAAMDFLIAWQPYHYEAGLRISVGASYTFDFFGTHTISVHVGTDVRFWGPEFGGTAHIDLDVISFTISFGSGGGADPKPVPWDRFAAAQLPAPGDAVTVVLRGGAPKNPDGAHLGSVNAADLELLTDSIVPATAGSAAGTGAASFGIAPVGAAPGTFTSVHTVTVRRGDQVVNSAFRFEPVGKDLPAALWGEELRPSLGAPALRANLHTGYVVRPRPPAEPAAAQTLPLSALKAAEAMSSEPAFSWTAPARFVPATGRPFDPAAGAATRDAIAAKLLPGLDPDPAGLTAADFLATPEAGAWTT
ncbi:DUF6603 domain-containing protein [Actinomadura flavalba]|uniref:DUF6603 domain-containing protein n=1 Tax=Actinomadura flavalba TaxID=1120938 RepID=UPI0003617A36|nr:DUF6603 domain-containing protein [Actinomadura flavalba]